MHGPLATEGTLHSLLLSSWEGYSILASARPQSTFLHECVYVCRGHVSEQPYRGQRLTAVFLPPPSRFLETGYSTEPGPSLSIDCLATSACDLPVSASQCWDPKGTRSHLALYAGTGV